MATRTKITEFWMCVTDDGTGSGETVMCKSRLIGIEDARRMGAPAMHWLNVTKNDPGTWGPGPGKAGNSVLTATRFPGISTVIVDMSFQDLTFTDNTADIYTSSSINLKLTSVPLAGECWTIHQMTPIRPHAGTGCETVFCELYLWTNGAGERWTWNTADLGINSTGKLTVIF